MNNKKITEDELIKMLDSFMGKGGGSVKPLVSEDGKCTFLTPKNEDDEEETKLFTGDVDSECVSCANIPNLTEGIVEDED